MTMIGDTPDVTDDADADDATGVMIALLPTTTDWCKIDLPHLTLVYAGTTDKVSLSDFNEMAKDASMLASLSRPIFADVLGVLVFGEDPEKVNVLDIQPTPELWAMRRAVEHWNASQYDWDPHCTIGPVEQGLSDMIPRGLGFNRILVSYGQEQLVFSLSY